MGTSFFSFQELENEEPSEVAVDTSDAQVREFSGGNVALVLQGPEGSALRATTRMQAGFGEGGAPRVEAGDTTLLHPEASLTEPV